MANKPPAFQFYAKDWRSSPTVQTMNLRQRGVYIDMLAAAWDSDEPGTLPLPIKLAAKVAMIDVRSVRDLLSKFPRTFVKVGSKLVNRKLREQYEQHMKYVESKSLAGKKGNEVRWHAESHSDRSASAFAPAPASAKSKDNTPLPPASGGVQFLSWCRETIEVQMGRRRRLPNLDIYTGCMASEMVEILARKGFCARIVTPQ